MKYVFFILSFLFPLLFSCGNKKETTPANQEILPVRYATGFSVSRFDTYTQIEIKDPWDSARIRQRYLLVDRTKELPSHLPAGTIVRTPIQHIVAYSSVICGVLDEIGASKYIVGVCEPEYIDKPSIQKGLQEGRIADLGQASSPDVEKIIDINAEVLVVTPFQNAGYGKAEKIGKPLIECADYMESTPLGRAEWIRFYGFLCGKEQVADSIFLATEKRYLQLKAAVDTVRQRPTVFSEKKLANVWYVPGGNSYMAHFFKDAGAQYIFADQPQTGSVALSIETVLDRAIHADFWLIKYNQAQQATYKELADEYALYSKFDAFRKHQIYGCNTGKVPIYEEIPTHPDYLLKDLIGIFHPDLLPEYTFRYYEKMKE